MNGDADMERVKEAVRTLGEHFDAVQVFVTKENEADEPDDRGTVNINYGSGNWFARYGHVLHWVTKCEERAREEVRDES